MSRTVEIIRKMILEVSFFFLSLFFSLPFKMTEAKTIWQWHKYKQVTWGHIFVADGLAGVANPHPPNPSSHTHTHTHILKNHLNTHFPTFRLMLTDGRTDWWIDGPTNRLTNIASYRVACPQLKKGQLFFSFQFWPLCVCILVGSSIGQFRPSTTNTLRCVLYCTSPTSILPHSHSYSNAHQVNVSPYHYQSSLNH